MKHWSRPGHILTIPAILLLTGSIVWVGMNSASMRGASSRAPEGSVGAPLLSLRPAWVGAQQQMEAPSLESMLRQISLDPAALTAAGVTSQQDVAAVVGRVRTHLTEYGVGFASAKADWLEAKAECESLERLARSGRASQQDLSDLATAQSQRSSDWSAFETAREGFFDAGVDGLATEVVNRLIAVRAHLSTEFRELPIQHLVESRTDPDLLVLREALAEERICAKWNENPSGGTTTLLASERERAAVSEASSRLEGSLATVESYWTAAIEQ